MKAGRLRQQGTARVKPCPGLAESGFEQPGSAGNYSVHVRPKEDYNLSG